MEYLAGLHAVLAWRQALRGRGSPGRRDRPRRIPDLAARLYRPRPQPLDAAGAGDAGLFPGPRHRGASDLRSPGKPAGRHNLEGQGVGVRPLLMGLARDKQQAVDLIVRHLGTGGDAATSAWPARDARSAADVATEPAPTRHAIRHGEMPPGTPQPYWSFPIRGRTLLVHTPLTPRPFDHTMSNALGHVVVVTNRGLHTSSSGNSQQNRLTPDWPDIVTRELPGEAFYLYDPDRPPVVFADVSSLERRAGRLPGRVQRRRLCHVSDEPGNACHRTDGVRAAARAAGHLSADRAESWRQPPGGCGWAPISKWCWQTSRSTPDRCGAP